MPKVALVGQVRFGNTKKIATELQKGGWSVELFDADRSKQFKHGRVPGNVDLVLMMVGHLPNGMTQRLKDGCRGVKLRFLEIPPDWSGTAVLLQKYSLLPAPAVIPNVMPTVNVAEVFTSQPTDGLKQRPFMGLGSKLTAKDPIVVKKVALVPTAPKPEPVVSAPPAPVEEKKMAEKPQEEKYATWKQAVKSDGEVSKPVNPYIASLIEQSAAASKVAEKLLDEGLAAVPPGDGYKKYREMQDAQNAHAVGEALWRRLRRRVRAKKGLPDDTAWWAGKAFGGSTPLERKRVAKEIMIAHPEWSSPRVIDEVREKCGLGVSDVWVRKEIEKLRRKEQRLHAPPAPVAPAQPVAAPFLQAVPNQPEPAPKAEQQAVVKAAMEALPAKLAVQVSREDERRAAIQLLKEVLVGSDVEELVFRRQPDGSFSVKGREVERRVKDVEY